MSPGEKPTSQIVDPLGAAVLWTDEVLVAAVLWADEILLIVGDEVLLLLVPVGPLEPDGM